jgi:hypothetical protein
MGSSLLGCGSASDDLAGDRPADDDLAEGGSGRDSSEAPAARRICDGSAEIRLAIAYGGGGQRLPFTSVLYELGSAFLYVDGSCHYWAAQPFSIVDEYSDWRPYREGVLSSEEERRLHEAVGYDDVAAEECASRPLAFDAGSEYLWDGSELHSCFDWSTPAHAAIRTGLFHAATAVAGPMRIQVGKASIVPNAPVYDWPLEAPIDPYVIEGGETRSFRVDDAAAVRALRSLRERAIADAEVAPGYWSGTIAIGPREGDGSYVMSLRDELPFAGDPATWVSRDSDPSNDE